MSKLHKKMVALGDMSQHSYDDVVEACGPPKETKPCEFSDIGEGTRSTWSDGLFTITFNFDSEGKYCGIYHHRNWEPYVWLGVVTAVLVAAAVIGAGIMRANSRPMGDAASLTKAVMDAQEVWRNEDTAGASIVDLDLDGTPELIAVDTEVRYYEELEADYFGACNARVFSLKSGAPTELLSFTPDGYCFVAELYRHSDAEGKVGWYYSSGGEVWRISLADGIAGTEKADGIPAGAEPVDIMQNESWVNIADNTSAAENIEADISAMAELWYGE